MHKQNIKHSVTATVSSSDLCITSSPNESSLSCKLASGIAATCCQETATFTWRHVNCMLFHTLSISKALRLQQLSCPFGWLQHNWCHHLLCLPAVCLSRDHIAIFLYKFPDLFLFGRDTAWTFNFGPSSFSALLTSQISKSPGICVRAKPICFP